MCIYIQCALKFRQKPEKHLKCQIFEWSSVWVSSCLGPVSWNKIRSQRSSHFEHVSLCVVCIMMINSINILWHSMDFILKSQHQLRLSYSLVLPFRWDNFSFLVGVVVAITPGCLAKWGYLQVEAGDQFYFLVCFEEEDAQTQAVKALCAGFIYSAAERFLLIQTSQTAAAVSFFISPNSSDLPLCLFPLHNRSRLLLHAINMFITHTLIIF